MKTSLSIRTLAFGLLLVMGLYGFSCGTGLEHCVDNKDCAAKQQCVANQCVSPASTPSGCRKDSDCKAGGVCTKGGRCFYKEICGDKLDNDHDGQVDEGCSSLSCQKAEDCKVDEVCSKGKCIKRPPPCGKEICGDKLDNDCDGEVDEGCANSCTSMKDCGKGQVCSKGKCIYGPPPCGKEICNDGKDNDCDGVVDEGCSKYCKSDADCGKGEFCGKGTCIRRSCGKEVCGDKLDNDCDGLVDEGCKPVCKTGETRPCYTGGKGTQNVGVCKGGIQQCNAGGQWGLCRGQISPRQELCGDNMDNDCDGLVDEKGCRLPPCSKDADCPSDHICGKGSCIRQCLSKEICGDKLDNDCDGLVDEGCKPVCKTGETRSCYTGVKGTMIMGTCRKGTQLCKNGQWGACQNEVKPGVEICGDKLDNNCNGLVDENCSTRRCKANQDCLKGEFCKQGVCARVEKACKADKDCLSGEICHRNRCFATSCYVKSVLTCYQGCSQGLRSCDYKTRKYRECGNLRPADEVCDGKDNDCDGRVDENCMQPCLFDYHCANGFYCARERCHKKKP